MTLRSFNLGIDNFIKTLVPDQVALTQRLITLQMLNGVVRRSPVDLGRFRGNWQVSLEAPVLDVLSALDAAGGLGGGEATLNANLGAVEGLKAFSISYVQNNLPYAGVLEDGSSKQAPGGMVSVTVESVGAQFR